MAYSRKASNDRYSAPAAEKRSVEGVADPVKPIGWLRYRPLRRQSGDAVTEAALFGATALVLLLGGLGIGGWRHYQAELAVAATAQQRRTAVPDRSRGAGPRQRQQDHRHLARYDDGVRAANISARTSGYIEKRYVDIGDRVKAGALLAEITAPELDHQIAQA
jgi:multidrug efflux pump subunit AcrA (membrane-fusion protein)